MTPLISISSEMLQLDGSLFAYVQGINSCMYAFVCRLQIYKHAHMDLPPSYTNLQTPTYIHPQNKQTPTIQL
jgi:hypothetical protein